MEEELMSSEPDHLGTLGRTGGIGRGSRGPVELHLEREMTEGPGSPRSQKWTCWWCSSTRAPVDGALHLAEQRHGPYHASEGGCKDWNDTCKALSTVLVYCRRSVNVGYYLFIAYLFSQLYYYDGKCGDITFLLYCEMSHRHLKYREPTNERAAAPRSRHLL